MSVVLTLTSAAVIAGISISSTTALAVINEVSNGTGNLEEAIPTMFQDCGLLAKTLDNFGCAVTVENENSIRVQTECGNLRYVRSDASQPFGLMLGEIKEPDRLFDYLMSFEKDYGRNVQAFTYAHIKENLTQDMEIANEEVLEDDSLLVTININ